MRRIAIIAGCLSACLAGSAAAHDGAVVGSPDLPPPSWETLGHPAGWPSLAPTPPVRAQLPAPAPPMPGRFELVGHEPLMNRGMNSALAVHGRYAYVGSRTDGSHPNAGVLVVDVGDPARPRVVHEIGRPAAANLGESSRELRMLPDAGLLMVLSHGCSELIHACVNTSQLGETIAPSVIRFFDVRGAKGAAPEFVGEYRPSRSAAQQPHEFFVWRDPRREGRVLVYETTPSSDGSGLPQLIVTDISGARERKAVEISEWDQEIGNPDRDNRLHSLTVSHDGRRAYLAFLGGGFLVADTSDFAAGADKPRVRLITPVEKRVFWTDPGAHSAVKLPGRPFALTTDEVYGEFGGLLAGHGCPWGWVRMIDVSDETAPRIVGELRPPWNQDSACAGVPADRQNFSSFASHNPTLTRNLALITWHSAGLVAADLSDPARPSLAAQFLPEPLAYVRTEDPALSIGRDKVVMWSYPIVQDGLIYVVDLRNGLYVLRYEGPFGAEVAGGRYLDGNTNFGDVGALERPAKKKKKTPRRPRR